MVPANIKIRGERPRPRLALLGKFESEEQAELHSVFPTIWAAEYLHQLAAQVSIREIDLLVIGNNASCDDPNWLNSTNVICFSETQGNLPSPIDTLELNIIGKIQTEEFYLPHLPLNIHRILDNTLSQTTNVKGWKAIDLSSSARSSIALMKALGVKLDDRADQLTFEKAQDLIRSKSLVLDRHQSRSLAIVFERDKSGLGVAWLPNIVFSKVPWIKAITSQWAPKQNERFPGIADWARSTEWAVKNELHLIEKIQKLEQAKAQYVAEKDVQIQSLSLELSNAHISADAELRALLTEQGDKLVQIVAHSFEEIGFTVTVVDDQLQDGKPKREDLRIRSARHGWEAIVEVRGYTKSSGTTGDLQRIARFASLYEREFSRWPDKRIYVVNGQFELRPDERQMPLESSPEDVAIFAEDSGLIVSTIDLFRAIKNVSQEELNNIKQSLMAQNGRWNPNGS